MSGGFILLYALYVHRQMVYYSREYVEVYTYMIPSQWMLILKKDIIEGYKRGWTIYGRRYVWCGINYYVCCANIKYTYK